MKRIFPILFFALLSALPAHAATYGRAVAPFENARPEKNETAWGRLVADAVRQSAGADIALINAAALKSGTLAAGDVGDAQINALLAFADDQIVTITISGAQLRAALERAIATYPTGSPAFLHGSGFIANFNVAGERNARLTSLQINGREVQDGDSIRAAMPEGLAKGGSGYFTIWNEDKAVSAKLSLAQAVGNFVQSKGTVSPESTPRIVPQ